MTYLLVVSLIWAFSFGLIKGNLTGLDSNFVAWIRMSISLLVFIPFLRIKGIERKPAVQLIVLGMVQYGLMYITYIYSYQFLKAYQIALFTIFTPLFVTLINDILEKRFHFLFLAVAILAILGTAIIVNTQVRQSDIRIGFLLMQLSNACFALGQVWYKKIMRNHNELNDVNIFSLLYFGAFIITFIAAFFTTEWSTLEVSITQVLTLLYLGIVASGVCFFLWNFGVKKTDIGALAIFNNMKVPLAVACSILFFNEKGNIPRLLIGGAIILSALFINEWLIRKKPAVINEKN